MKNDFINKLSSMKIGKYGDKLLFILALVFLVMAIFRLWGYKPIRKAETPPIVFTQWWEKDSEIETLEILIEEFESLNSGVKITLNTRSYDDLRRDLFDPGEGSIVGNEFPGKSFPGDIIALDPLWVCELLDRGIIENANNPLVSFINVFYYNIRILRDAGFLRPPKSRGEFLDYARALAAGAGERGCLAIGMNGSRGIYDDIFPWIWAAGAQLITDGKPSVNNRPVIESLSFLADLNAEGLIAPGALSSNSQKLDDFVSGRAAFMVAPASEIGHVKESLGDGFGVTSIPVPDNYAGKSLLASAGWTLGVYSPSTHKEEAGLFVDFLAEKASSLMMGAGAMGAGTMPGSGLTPASDDLYLKVWDITIAGELAEDFSGLPWTELEEAFREELSAMFGGAMFGGAIFGERSSPAEAAAAIQKKWEAILSL